MRPCGVFDEKYEKDIAIIRTWQHWVILALFVAFLFLLPYIAPFYFVNFANQAFIGIIVVLGLQIVMGYCGQISLGQPAFVAVGAYTSAILTLHYGFTFWLALPLAGIMAGIVGIIGGAPSLRIKGFYLAMSTIAILFVILWIITHLDITGGIDGLSPPPPQIGDFAFDSDERMYYLIMITTLLMTFFARNLVRSRVGRAFVAIRDNDLAAEVMGINLYYYKLLAFFISCFYAGVAGALYGHWYMAITPEQFSLMHALIYVGAIIIGGMGSIPGAYFGIIFLHALDELVLFGAPKLAVVFPWLGISMAASLGLTVFGLILIIFLIYEPRGLAHAWEKFKVSYRVYPFMH
jgi:branched-chain amino acid transport system permease protein